MKKMLFIINPVSGKRVLEDCLMDIVSTFCAADYDVNVYVTKSEQDMMDTAGKRADEFDIIVCCGGDGTLNIVAGAVYHSGSSTIIGYIPGGTTNDFANSHRINTVASAAAKQIASGTVRQIDLGLLCSSPFIYVAAFGVFSAVSYETSRELKQNLGHAAYVIEGIKSLAKAKSYRVKVRYNGNELEEDLIYGMVSNSKRVGGFEMPIMQNVLYDDGEMEVMLIRQPKNPVETTKLLNCLVTQVADDDMIRMFRTSRLEYECDEEIPWTIDGEFGGSYGSGVVDVCEGALKMLY